MVSNALNSFGIKEAFAKKEIYMTFIFININMKPWK